MRAHQAASSASSTRGKIMRPRVVGPSPVITPSRTMVRASAAVLRQEIFEVSMATIGSTDLAAEADIGTLLIFLFLTPAFPCGRKRLVNDSKLERRLFLMVAGLAL